MTPLELLASDQLPIEMRETFELAEKMRQLCLAAPSDHTAYAALVCLLTARIESEFGEETADELQSWLKELYFGGEVPEQVN